MKIGRNDPCPCGSGKKYKKCCLGKEKLIINDNIIDLLKEKEVKNPEINNKLINIYMNKDKLSTKKIIDGFLEVMNYILDYAEEHNIRTFEELDKENLIEEFTMNVFYDFDLEILNLNIDKEEYDLNITNKYLDRVIEVLNLDDSLYETVLRNKANSLFKLGKIDEGEQIMLDLIKEKHNSIYPYVELVDDFIYVGNKEKAKYYYDLGMKQKNLKDLDVLESREDELK